MSRFYPSPQSSDLTGLQGDFNVHPRVSTTALFSPNNVLGSPVSAEAHFWLSDPLVLTFSSPTGIVWVTDVPKL